MKNPKTNGSLALRILGLCMLMMWSFGDAMAQIGMKESDHRIMKRKCEETVGNYYAVLNLIGDKNSSVDEKDRYIENLVSNAFYNEEVRVYNDLSTDGVPNFLIDDYLHTIKSRCVEGGVAFEHQILEVNGPHLGESNYAFYVVRVNRELSLLTTNEFFEENQEMIDIYVRFEWSHYEWALAETIYDIREATVGRDHSYDSIEVFGVGSQCLDEKSQEELTEEILAILKGEPLISDEIWEFIENMVYVKGGTFNMGCIGSEEECLKNDVPFQRITVGDFSISKYEVTHVQWCRVMDEMHSSYKGCNDCPVEGVGWFQIMEFLYNLNYKVANVDMGSLPPEQAAILDELGVKNLRFRLPTSAEWEFAARGGVHSKGFQYSGSNNVREVAWCQENSKGEAQPVGLLKPNELDLYDMNGNVAEWCNDWFPLFGSEHKVDENVSLYDRNGEGLRGFYYSWPCGDMNDATTFRVVWPFHESPYAFGFRLAL